MPSDSAAPSRTALYAGTFDPITYGHLDVIERACRLFEKVVVAVAPSEGKHPLFSLEERIALARENVKKFENAQVVALRGLTVDFAAEQGACALIRGLRAVSDFDFEFQMAQMNRHLNDKIETLFLMPNQTYFYTSSTLVKQVCSVEETARIAKFVPPNVIAALVKKRG